jgi:hypothetical protein
MKLIIGKILKEQIDSKSHLKKLKDSPLKTISFKLIDKYIQLHPILTNYSDVEGLIDNISEKLALSYSDASFFIFSYLIDENDDPTDHRGLSDWLYKVTLGEELDFLKLSGYYDNFMDYRKFDDLEFTEDGKTYLNVADYSEFAYWFDDANLAESVFGEDWLDLFDLWDLGLEEICNYLDEPTLLYLIDVIASENDYLVELGHREEWEEIVTDDGVLNLTPFNVSYIKSSIDSYNMNVLISESNLSGGEIERHLRSSFSSAYNLAAEDELFEQFKGEIEDFMGTKIEIVEDGLRIDVTNSVEKLTDQYFTESHENPIDQHSTLLDMLNGLFEYYIDKLYTFDSGYYYPDHRKVEEHFNYMVKENY